jgi:hypothetical protein
MAVATYPGCDAVRQLLMVSRVAPGKIPTWLKNILKEAYANLCLEPTGEGLSRALAELLGPELFDHCGMTEWDGIRDCFVSEPYGVPANAVVRLREIGRQLGFAVVYDAVSYYYPGGCQRVLLFPTTTVLKSSSHPAAVLALLEAGGTVDGI